MADARVEGDIGRGYEGGSLEQQEEEEEEFDGVRSVSGRRGTGLKNAGGGSGGDDDDLGGVAMPHDEMVAVDREQELPEASQQSFAVTQVGSVFLLRRDGLWGGGSLSSSLTRRASRAWVSFLGMC